MIKRQQIEANLELSRRLLERLLQDPANLGQIPEAANLVILPLDDPALFQANLQELLTLKEANTKELVVVVLESTAALKPKLLVRVGTSGGRATA